jgi:hypothetical protein
MSRESQSHLLLLYDNDDLLFFLLGIGLLVYEIAASPNKLALRNITPRR